MIDPEDRKIGLIEELWDMLDDLDFDQGVGSLLRQWAEKCLEYEQEERAAVLAFAQTAGAPKVLIDMIERGDHRKRSTGVMKALRDSERTIAADRKEQLDRMVRDYVGGE